MSDKLKSTGSQLKFAWAEQPFKLNHSPLCISNIAYVFADYLCYRSPNSKVTRKGSGFRIDRRNQKITFRLDSRTYQVNGQTHRMSAEPVLVNGRCYVPLDVMQAVLGGKWSYDAKAKTVRYDPPPVKQARR